MAFLFKSKKHQDRNITSRDGPPPTGVQSPAGRVVRDEKQHSRATPTGSLHSLDEGGGSPDVEKYAARRAAQQEPPQHIPPQQQTSDLPVGSVRLGRPAISLVADRHSLLSFGTHLNRPRTRHSIHGRSAD